MRLVRVARRAHPPPCLCWMFCPNCGRPKAREAAVDALVGKLLGERFQVQELLGQGKIALQRPAATQVTRGGMEANPRSRPGSKEFRSSLSFALNQWKL